MIAPSPLPAAERPSRWAARLAGKALALALLAALPSILSGCPEAQTAADLRPPKAEKWLQRAEGEYRVAEIDSARDSIQQALDLAPADEQIRVLAAKVALARLEYGEVERLLRGVRSTEALSLLGRAYWYAGKLELAAEALQAVLADPEFVDPWAKAVHKLALQGAGRKPFALSGGLLAAVDLPRIDPRAPVYVVPLEIDGEAAFALVATATAEVVLDNATRREPSWVSLRFGKRLEVSDVPALTEDLSGLSNQLGAPIKALLGANLLRQLNVTIDFKGRQFVARSFSPPPPPLASRVDLFYLRGGGMILGTALGTASQSRAALFVDTSMSYPVALDEAGWQKIGVVAASLPLVPDDPSRKLRTGAVPLLRLGGFELPQIPAVFGAPLDRMERELAVDVDGVIGAGLLASFRLTFADGGRMMWVEQGVTVPAPPALATGQGPSGPRLQYPSSSLGGPAAPGAATPAGSGTTPASAPPTAPAPGVPAPTR